MREVGAGLGAGVEGETLGHGTGAQAGDLREDEPHPMAAFLTGAQFTQRDRIRSLLGEDEALEVKRIGGGGRAGFN